MRDKNLNIMEHVIEHQRVREIGKVTFDSRFPAGNLLRCEEVDANTVQSGLLSTISGSATTRRATIEHGSISVSRESLGRHPSPSPSRT